MREDHQSLQTPRKEPLLSSNRKVKPINAQSKKLPHNKNIKKNLNSVFAPEAVSKSPEKSSIDKISEKISEAYDDNQSTVIESSERNLNFDTNPVNGDVASEVSTGISPISESFLFEEDQTENYIMSMNQIISSSPRTPGAFETTPSSTADATPLSTTDMTSSSSTITVQKAEVIDALVTRFGDVIVDQQQTNPVKVEPVAKHLSQSMVPVLSSADIDPRYEKLLDALVKIVIEDFSSPHEEKGRVQLFTKKVKIMFLSFVLLILAVFIFSSGGQSSLHGPPPT